ncbi:hypothetical protein Esti_003002 [Eimeria stiedai]
MAERVLVLYFVPNDGDDPATPNCFFLSRPKGGAPITLRDVRDNFPLPGSYHFRQGLLLSSKPWFCLASRVRVYIQLNSADVSCRQTMHACVSACTSLGLFVRRLRVDPRQLSASAAVGQQREEKGRHVWLDLPQDLKPLPSNGPVLFFKALRISWSGGATASAAEAAAPAAAAASVPAAAAPTSSSSSSSSNGKVIGGYWDSQEQKKETVPPVSGVSAAPSHQGDMLLFDEAPPAAPGGSKPSHDGIDLML